MNDTLSISFLIPDLAKGDMLLDRRRTGDRTSQAELDVLVWRLLEGSLDRIYAPLGITDRAGLKRLCRRLFHESDMTTLFETHPGQGFLDVLFHAMASLFGRVHERLDQIRERDEEQRFKKAVKECLSFQIEDQLICRLSLKDILKDLRRHNREAYECMSLRYWLSFTLDEIAESKRLSVQQVRTRIQKAMAFIKSRL